MCLCLELPCIILFFQTLWLDNCVSRFGVSLNSAIIFAVFWLAAIYIVVEINTFSADGRYLCDLSTRFYPKYDNSSTYCIYLQIVRQSHCKVSPIKDMKLRFCVLENSDKFSLRAVLHEEPMKCSEVASRLGLARLNFTSCRYVPWFCLRLVIQPYFVIFRKINFNLKDDLFLFSATQRVTSVARLMGSQV